MSKKILAAKVFLWGILLGKVSWDEIEECGFFEYDPGVLSTPFEPAPLKMPKRKSVYVFKDLDKTTFKGLPGMLIDSLPDKFGNALIDVWLAGKKIRSVNFNPVERLCFTGTRGMGALEFKPFNFKVRKDNVPIEINTMVNLSCKILTDREKFSLSDSKSAHETLTNLFIVGTSAGGARAKCIIVYNEKTGEIKSGQINASKDFTYWLLKLDGVSDNKDKEANDPKGYGRIEYAYHLIAKDCNIEMMECKLLEESGSAHFMTKRFDRLKGGNKLHMLSLCAIAHFGFNTAGAYSYEQVMNTIKKVVTRNLSYTLDQQFRRAVFNVIGRNHDDHTKNIAFLMNKKGEWSLSPAYDITYNYNPDGKWTNCHQMSINGERDKFKREDLISLAQKADIKKSKADKIIDQIKGAFLVFDLYALKAKIYDNHKKEIKKHLRLNI